MKYDIQIFNEPFIPMATKYMSHTTFYLIFGNWYLPKSLHNLNLIKEKGWYYIVWVFKFYNVFMAQMFGAHQVVCDVLASIPCEVGFHMKWEQLHALPSIIFNSFC
jgi:hypothetical protein